VWPADLKRHFKNKHGHQKSTFEQQQRYTPEQFREKEVFLNVRPCNNLLSFMGLFVHYLQN
jgi:hypothetical protein